jgi:hypothetical protein
MRRLAWTLLALATALVPPHHKRHTRRTVQQKANIFEQAADAASKFFEERARQDSLALAKFTEGLEKSRQNFLSDLRGIFDVKGASLDQTLEKLRTSARRRRTRFWTTSRPSRKPRATTRSRTSRRSSAGAWRKL